MSAKPRRCRWCRGTEGDLEPVRFDATGSVYRYQQRMHDRVVAWEHPACLAEREVIERRSWIATRLEQLEEYFEGIAALQGEPAERFLEERADLLAELATDREDHQPKGVTS